jgi:hypothetical protein
VGTGGVGAAAPGHIPEATTVAAPSTRRAVKPSAVAVAAAAAAAAAAPKKKSVVRAAAPGPSRSARLPPVPRDSRALCEGEELHVGARVHCNWEKRGLYYEATVTTVVAGGGGGGSTSSVSPTSYTVKYVDDVVEAAVLATELRVDTSEPREGVEEALHSPILKLGPSNSVQPG